MNPSQVPLVPRKKITSSCQGGQLTSDPSEEYPYFSKDTRKFKERTIHELLILNNAAEDVKKATRLSFFPAAIGSCAVSMPFAIGHMPILERWVKVEKHEVFTSRSKSFSKGAKKNVQILGSTGHSSENKNLVPQTLGFHIYCRDVSWDSFTLNGEFNPPKGYWEWAELSLSRNKEVLERAGIYKAIIASLFVYDRRPWVIRAFCESWCFKTNTLITGTGEMSISLWDLYELGGLPILGEFYDEVTPSLEEITGLDEDSHPVIPFSCRSLLYALHLIRSEDDSNSSRVSIDSWISWWFRGELHYDNPFTTTSVKQLGSMRLPTGKFSRRTRTVKESSIFEELGVSSDNEDEVHLAAFLATWLCVFVLPSKRGLFIRAETFKVASFMARGIRFCLAIPVLARIYNGLNCLVKHKEGPSKSQAYLPWHYVYAWLGEYFGTHKVNPGPNNAPEMCRYAGRLASYYYSEADGRQLFYQNKNGWQPTRKKWVDEGELFESPTKLLLDDDFEYLVSIRTSYLTLRQGDFYFLEPYSPHRFARQFGYCQDLPGSLIKDIRCDTLDNLIFWWRCSLYRYTPCRLLYPSFSVTDAKLNVTGRFIRWWHGKTSSFFANMSKFQDASSKSPSPLVLNDVPLNTTTGAAKGRAGLSPISPPEDKRETSSGKKRGQEPKEIVGEFLDLEKRKKKKLTLSNYPLVSSESLLEVQREAPEGEKIDETPCEDTPLDKNLGRSSFPVGGDMPTTEVPMASIASICGGENIQHEVRRIKATPNILIRHNTHAEDKVYDDTASSGGTLGEKFASRKSVAPSFSSYQPARVAGDVRGRAAQMMGNQLLRKLKDAPYSQVHNVKKGAQGIYVDIEMLGGESLTIRSIVDHYVAEVEAFLLMEKQVVGKTSDSQIASDRVQVASELQSAKSSLTLVEQEKESCQQELGEVQKEIIALEESLNKARERESSLTTTLQCKIVDTTTAKEKVASIQHRLEEIESAPTVSQKQLDDLEELRGLLEKRREELCLDQD